MQNKSETILLTGAAGFIGSYMLGYLNKQGYEKIVITDDFSRADKVFNYETKKYLIKINRGLLFDWLKVNDITIDFVFHLGARTDTTESDYSIHEKWNLEYSKKVWNYCTENNVPLVYASSAATYGDGALGYKDDPDIVRKLHPLNAYGLSKNEFDKWALKKSQESGVGSRESAPPFWAGLKFFNVYGPNEYHKGRMASVIFHSFKQIQKTGKVKLFRSHKPRYRDGEQLRDFIYVEDVVKVMYWMMKETGGQKSETGDRTSDLRPLTSGLYNLGTGKARTFNDLVKAVFAGAGKSPLIEYVDMPEDIRDKYQYFTEADMTKLKKAGYNENFYSLEEGIKEYVAGYLTTGKHY
jgi:ADP-L-glycero-D-manno-heptose 6-epimerase